MSAPTDNMPVAVAVPRTKPILLRHSPYFICAAIVVALAAGMRFDGYVLNILMQATMFSIAVFGLSVVLRLRQIDLSTQAEHAREAQPGDREHRRLHQDVEDVTVEPHGGGERHHDGRADEIRR